MVTHEVSHTQTGLTAV